VVSLVDRLASMRPEYRADRAETMEIIGRNWVYYKNGTSGGPAGPEWHRGGDDYDRYHYLRGQITGLGHKRLDLGCDSFEEESD
jgi:hypothetical protein